MFIHYMFDVKTHLKEGENKIKITFKSPIEYAMEQYDIHLFEKYEVPPLCPQPIQHGECHANFIRKIQSQFSWDWGPAFPSMGIWKNIGLEAFDYVTIRDVTVTTLNDASGEWTLLLRIYCDLAGSSSSSGTLIILLNSKEIFNETIQLAPDSNLEANFNITAKIPTDITIERWWPNGAGDQILYNLTVLYVPHRATIGISKSMKIGFRSVDLIQDVIPDAYGLTFYFRINGINLFLKGSNWIPADSFPERITTNYTRHLLQSAKEANMNVLRLWGGGMYEMEEFYEIADELGIMIWHDLMFACSMYPATQPFLNNVRDEITGQVRRLQHHPSILLWSGNNENEVALVQNWYFTRGRYEDYKADYLDLYLTTIKPIVKNIDADRPFLLSSPSNGIQTEQEGGIATDPQSNQYGDIHYYNYGANSWNWTTLPIPRFISEYGYQSWASFETISKVSIPEDWNTHSEFFSHRQHNFLAKMEMSNSVRLHFGLENTCNAITSSKCDSEPSFEDFLYLTQIVQAMAVKTSTEHYRRRQSDVVSSLGLTMGALYWQLNDVWQCPSWSSIEYGGKWKMLQYYAKRFFAPVMASPFENYEKLEIYIISDNLEPLVNWTLNLYVYQWKNSTPLYSLSINFNQKPTCAQKVYEVNTQELLESAKSPGRNYSFLYMTVSQNHSSVPSSSNFYFLSDFQSAIGLADPRIQVTVKNGSCDALTDECTYSIVLTVEEVAPFVWLEAKGISGRFSDNGFIGIPPSVMLEFHSWQVVSAEELYSKISVKSLVDVYSHPQTI